jgi:hypothetical protein
MDARNITGYYQLHFIGGNLKIYSFINNRMPEQLNEWNITRIIFQILLQL